MHTVLFISSTFIPIPSRDGTMTSFISALTLVSLCTSSLKLCMSFDRDSNFVSMCFCKA